MTESTSELHHYEILVYGAVLMVVMLVFPEGLVSLPGRIAHALARRRRPNAGTTVGARVAP